jgi:hypothetical protein
LNSDDLLQPTLSGHTRSPALYNSSGFFLSSFFGGPVGAALYGLANSRRLGRLPADLPVIGAMAVIAFLLAVGLHRWGALVALAGWLDVTPARAGGLSLRALGLLCFCGIYLLHRRFYRAARVSGVQSQPGWMPGILAVVVGVMANLALVTRLLHH